MIQTVRTIRLCVISVCDDSEMCVSQLHLDDFAGTSVLPRIATNDFPPQFLEKRFAIGELTGFGFFEANRDFPA